ncbi:hypothetical protein NXS19_005727 [Fusarium pseudograminearum]|nr:hypothetical protein NXS19_005727 [Fusarium pseudograminearum]
MDLFRIRLNCIDHYQATATQYDPQLRNDIRPSQISKGPKVPIVRIFGATETGQKVCAHIHGAFPYLYVEYEGGLSPDEVGAYIYRFHLSIDHALAVSYRRDQKNDNARFVARITLVKGIPFFGFHVGYRFFLKIYMFNPVVMTRLADLLQQGVIMKHKFQPYEAHLQFLLQFMTDFNLYGCDYLESSSTGFRSPVPEYGEETNSSHLWHSESIPQEDVTDETTLPRSSHCSLEVDICVQDILNRHRVKERPLHHDFTERTNPLPSDMKLVYSMAGLWKDETKRRKQKMQDPSEGSSPFPPEVLVSMSANPRDSQPQGWIHEEEHRIEIQNLISEEKVSIDGDELTFETFAKHRPYEENISTALESVEDLFPSKLALALGLPSDLQPNQDPESSILVDEGQVRQVREANDNFLPDDSDEEAITALVAMEKAAAKGFRDPTNQLLEEDLEQAAALDISLGELGQRPFWSSIIGVGRSGLASGKLPDIPLGPELFDYAEDEGLVGRAFDAPKYTLSSSTQLKRPMPDVSSVQMSNKRLRFDEQPMIDEDDMDLVPIPSTDLNKPLISSFRGSSILKGPSSINKSIGSVLKGAAGSNQKLNFPTVKDQNDPNTRLRLSQLSQKSASQQTDDGQHTKHVSFDPSSFLPAEAGPSQMTLSSSLILSGGDEGENDSQQSKIQRAMRKFASPQVHLLFSLPPSAASVVSTLKGHMLPDVIYQDAYYSKEKDVPGRTREYAGKEFRLEGNTLPFLPEFDPTATSPASYGLKYESLDRVTAELQYERQGKECSWKSWEFASPHPHSRRSRIGGLNRSAKSIRWTDPGCRQLIETATLKSKDQRQRIGTASSTRQARKRQVLSTRFNT